MARAPHAPGDRRENDVGTVTLGVSIAVPEPYGSLLQECRTGFGDTAAHGIPTHVTLLPPTEVDAALRPAVEEHLAAVAAAGRAFPLRLSGTDTFRPLSPVVFVRVVEGAGDCGRLQEHVRSPEGPLARELSFPYHPHVTVAHHLDDKAMDRAAEELADFEAAWTVTGFALYEQGGDGVWRLQRHFLFAEQHPLPALPHQVHHPSPLPPHPFGPDGPPGATALRTPASGV
jgi:2'-5' RNA ligase